jgi:tetraacyldisaccharide 4'-kinase
MFHGNEEEINAASVQATDDIEISGKCAYKDVHDEFDRSKKIAILDDGFTALNVKKNINILLIDANIDIFIQNVIPAGILREPLSVLKYADIIVINKCKPELLANPSEFKNDAEIKIKKYNKNCPVFYSYYKPDKLVSRNNAIPCADLKGKKSVAVCAIGNPGYFYENLANCGAEIDYKMEFRDHYEYAETDMKNLGSLMAQNKEYIAITTLKDYVKLKRFNKSSIFDRIYYLDFEIVIDKAFFEYIYNIYKKNRT